MNHPEIVNSIEQVWETLCSDINEKRIIVSSEMAVVYQFAWRLNARYKNLEFDFERQIDTDIFIDMLMFEKATDIKYGFEFKFPLKSAKGNSNQTETRVKAVHDIKRLLKLIQDQKINYGTFLMATNEAPYIYKGDKELHGDFHIYDGFKYNANQEMPIESSLSPYQGIVPSHDIEFQWIGSNGNTIKGEIAWIKPIFLYK